MSDSEAAFPQNKTVTYTRWGRSALEAGLRAANLTDTDVLLPAFIEQAAFSPLFDRLGLDPMFADIDPVALWIDPEEAKDAITEVDGVIVVHPFGLPADMNFWTELCADHDVTLIEDCVRALGAKFDGDPVGSFAPHAVYSLYKVSPVSIGGAVASEGDAVSYLDEPIYDVFALYHALPDEIQSDLALKYPLNYESRKLDGITSQRFNNYLVDEYQQTVEQLSEKYDRLREALEPLGFQFQPDAGDRRHFLVPSIVPSDLDRDALQSYLHSNVHNTPAHAIWANPWAKSIETAEGRERFPNMSTVADRILCFRLKKLSDTDLDETIEEVQTFVDAQR
jgi:dTDP-4-amino-4,6-dideoxygalactose transaminase